MKEILLKEYETLKSEQLARIKHRDNIIYVLLSAAGALFSFAIIHDTAYVVAIVPMISFVLCWMYLANDRKISEIGTYVTEDLSARLSKIMSEDKTSKDKIFYWETKHKTHTGRKARKLIQYIVDLLVFGFPALVGVLMVSAQANSGYVFSIDSLFFTGIIAMFVVHYSDKSVTQEDE